MKKAKKHGVLGNQNAAKPDKAEYVTVSVWMPRTMRDDLKAAAVAAEKSFSAEVCGRVARAWPARGASQ